MELNIAVVLCGGNGSRLWPLSTIHTPKQFIDFFGGKTLLENTVERVPKKYHIVLVSNRIYEPFMDKFKDNNIVIYEKSKKNTAPSILSAMLYLRRRFNNVEPSNINFIVLPSDHYFENEKFHKMLEEGERHLRTNITTFGIKPSYPEVGYGYIKFNGDKVEKFIEKPSLDKATALVADGNYLWNSGVFMFNYETVISLYRKYHQDMVNICQKAIDNATIDNNIIHYEVDEELCPDISFDYAIMERVDDGMVVKYDGEWNDLGCWDRVYDFNDKDNNNNVVFGRCLTHNTKNSYIYSNKGIVTTIGLSNMVVVRNGSDILVSDMDNCNNVKLFNEHLEDYHKNKKNYRPWGSYEVILKEQSVQVKKLIVYPRKRLSLQYHNHRSEHWVVAKGCGEAVVGDKILSIKKDDHIYVKVGEIHRIHNTGNDNMEIIETQIGDYLEEDDIVRIEDDFGRK